MNTRKVQKGEPSRAMIMALQKIGSMVEEDDVKAYAESRGHIMDNYAYEIIGIISRHKLFSNKLAKGKPTTMNMNSGQRLYGLTLLVEYLYQVIKEEKEREQWS